MRDVCCKFCNFSLESPIHLLKACWWFKATWATSGLKVELLEHHFSFFADWIHYLSMKLEEDEFQKAVCIMWFVWYIRNLKWHGEDDMDIQTCVQKINAFIKRSHFNLSVYQISQQQGTHRWLPPSNGYTKINCDGAWRATHKVAGIGVICRTEEGIVLAARSVYLTNIMSSFEAEGLVIMHGFLLAKELGLKKALFETDCTKAAEAIWFGHPSLQVSDHSNWLYSSTEELSRNRTWQLLLIRREANSVADFMAKQARDSGSSWTHLNSCPVYLGSVL